ncbi:MAG: BTAD domain-containing putative transcriptional regulator [Steroidobacteraceae bacterium]|jgi:DNA-binding SARP family transcriptional activator|nr:BTAD domain-containing putative transcriptional regulator [Steroidobacteraceae bacterium]
MSELTLQMLGAYRVHAADGGELRIASRKGRALLAYLALRPDETHSRERLAALLWEDADEELARTSLRQALAALRRALPRSAQAALNANAESLRVSSALIATDVGAFRRALLEGQTIAALKTAVEHYRGDLLEGFDARSTAFDEWLSNERLLTRKHACEALHKLTQLCISNDDVDGALSSCTRLVALEPLNEAAHRTLMELHARRQSYAEALRQYRLCRDTLRRELDVAPEPATEQLYREVMRRRRAALPGAETAAAREESEDRAPHAEPAAASRAELTSQLREAVVLVARLDGLLELEAQLDPEESLALSEEFQRRVRRAAQEYGGIADRRVGSNVLAVFGAPTAHGNEAQRAARAALSLRTAVNRSGWPAYGGRPLALRIGLAQGQVLCTADLFPLTGKPTHLAHLLAARAGENEILISSELRQSLGEAVHAQRASTAPEPGGEPVSAWSLQGLRTEGAGPQPFVGRRPELAMMLAALDRCSTTRRGRAIVVRGEAGIGKSRLVEAVVRAARERGVATHCAQVFDFGQSPGSRPITTLAASLLGLDADASPSERIAAVRRDAVVRGGSIDQIVFLSDLVDAPLDAELAALANAMEPTARQRGRALALAQLIESAAQRSALLLVVQDVHWVDEGELARLGEIAGVAANCPILFIMTTRPENDPISAAWRARVRGCPVTTLDLAPLGDDEAHELAAHYTELPTETIEECIRRAEGFPLFLDQLLRSASAGHDALPGSVHTLVLARADRLSPRDHRALQAAAVLGQRTSLAAVRRMIGDEDYEPAELVAAALARFDGVDIEFSHALFRDAIYESTLKSRRRELHRAAAELFAESDPALYADHLAAADDERAAAAYLDAAHVELTALRLERALALASKAAARAREPTMLHRTSAMLGELLLQLGRTHEALAAYREALDFAIDPREQGQAWFGLAAALRIMDRHEEALEALDRAESALEATADARMRARLLTLRGNLCFPLGNLDACLRAHEQAHRYALQANSHLDIARALGGLGDAYYQRGHMLTARSHFAQCVQEARNHGLVGVLLANLPMLGVTQTYCGAPGAGRESCSEALELARRIGDVRSELLAHITIALGLMVQLELEECRRRAQQALQLSRQIGARRFEAESLGMLATTLLAEQDREQALQLAEEALQIGRETGMSYCGPVLLSIVARASADPERRRKTLGEGEELLARGCVSHSYFEFYGNAIEVSLAVQAWGDVRRYADGLEEYTAEEPLPLTNLLIARARALADVGEGVANAETYALLQGLRSDCQRMNARAALGAIDAALRSHDSNTSAPAA